MTLQWTPCSCKSSCRAVSAVLQLHIPHQYAGNFTHYWPTMTAVTCSWRWQFEFGNIWCTNLALTDQGQGNRGSQNRLLKVQVRTVSLDWSCWCVMEFLFLLPWRSGFPLHRVYADAVTIDCVLATLLAFVDESKVCSSDPRCRWALKPYAHPLYQKEALGSASPAPKLRPHAK